MRSVISSDHAGFELKTMRELVGNVVDVAVPSADPVDYPDFAEAVGKPVLDGRADRGVLNCGGGVGASVAATGLCHDSYSANQGVEHEDMNVL
jgi:RpiB/LacA/LacB family sugar-phosphate isomerase